MQGLHAPDDESNAPCKCPASALLWITLKQRENADKYREGGRCSGCGHEDLIEKQDGRLRCK